MLVDRYGKTFQDMESNKEIETSFSHNGKPVYYMLLERSNITMQNGSSYAHNISNIDEILDYEAGWKRSDTNTYYKFMYLDNTQKALYVYFNRTNFNFVGASAWNARPDVTFFAHILYTKTTD